MGGPEGNRRLGFGGVFFPTPRSRWHYLDLVPISIWPTGLERLRTGRDGVSPFLLSDNKVINPTAIDKLLQSAALLIEIVLLQCLLI